MNEETKIEFKMPFFEENELEFIDNNIHELAHKFTEQFLKEKDLLIAQRIVKNLEQELQRKDNEIKQLQEAIVNHIKIASEYKEQMIIKDNIINGIEEYVRSYYDLLVKSPDIIEEGQLDVLYEVLDKIKELEESK